MQCVDMRTVVNVNRCDVKVTSYLSSSSSSSQVRCQVRWWRKSLTLWVYRDSRHVSSQAATWTIDILSVRLSLRRRH